MVFLPGRLAVVSLLLYFFFFFFQAEDGIRDKLVTGVQTCALPISSLDSLASASSCAVTFAASRWLISPLMITVRARNSRSATRLWTGTSTGSSEEGGGGSSSMRTPGLRPTMWRKLRHPTTRLNPLARLAGGREGGGEAQLEPFDLCIAHRIAHAPLARGQVGRASLHLDEDDALDVSSAEPVEDYKIDRGAQKPGVLRVELEPGQQRHELLVHLSGRYGLAPQHRVEAHHARVPRLPQEEAQQDRDGADKQQEDERECHGRCRSQVREMSRAGIEPAACGLKVRCSTN